MKKIILLSIFAIFAFSAQSQNAGSDTNNRNRSNDEIRTLMGSNRGSNGGYGSFGAGYSMIDGKDAVTLSGRAAWIMNHSIALGFAGTGFVNEFSPTGTADQYTSLAGGYGGILFEPILLPKFPAHLSFPIIAGVGGIAYTTSTLANNSWEYYDTWVEDTETFLILEPGVELELNVLKFFRIAFGLSYRLTTDIQWEYTGSDVLEGINAGVSFKFGKF